CVDYLALGHVHKPFEFYDWMYNPGSTETCGAEESLWEDRGYYYVQIDTDIADSMDEDVTDSDQSPHRATHLVSTRRPFVRHELERRIFEDLVSRDNRYLAHREEWSKVLADLKRMSLDKDDPAVIARFLREKQAELSGA